MRRETLPLDDADETIEAVPSIGVNADSAVAARREGELAAAPSDLLPTRQLEPAADPGDVPLPPSPLRPGDVFLGKYKIENLIGAGGMGSVVLARHMDLGAAYAIKVMHTSVPDRAAVNRFKREAKTSAMIDHPNIVRVFDCGEHDGHCYIIMEYLPGENLRQRLGRLGRFTVEEVVRFAGVVCDVLEVMHEAGIVHRDLKPDNIVFSQRAGSERIKILDFGIAKLATASVSGHLTQTGTVVGTPAYMSPEQCMAGQIDGRSDIYALGVILFQMLTGRLPFDSDNLLTMMYLHVNQAAPDASEWEPTVPAAVAAVVKRMMAKSPDDRFQSATRCAAALSEAANVYIPIRATTGQELSAAKAVATPAAMPAPSGPHATVARGAVQGSGESPALKSTSRRVWLGLAAGVLAAGAVGVLLSFSPILRPTMPGPGTPNASAPGPNAGTEPKLAEHFVSIPAGEATVGVNPDDCNDIESCNIDPAETPSHVVPVGAFWLAKFEVTNKEYADFVQATNHPAPASWRGSYPRGADAYPVTNVTWNDAVAYAAWRAEQDHVAYRLPTEAEWEYAARGAEGRMFPWGDIWNANNVNGGKLKAEGGPLPAAQAPNTNDVTPTGITALAGNVSEWTSSAFAAYPGSTFKPKAGDLSSKVIRGGSFNQKPNASRTSYRYWQLPEYKAYDLGFRLAADAPQP